MEKFLISVPDQLAIRMRATIPPKQRSKTIVHLLEEEVLKRERSLYECAVAVEADAALRLEMQAWDATLKDGLDDETW